ncbi:MAG TPA: helix-turn-helix domain-containing protein [Solirubrobacteraceae bacterium]|nr:helix-turn-helix domain-containing protein [Solirubrobacteraceae bacterium]
MTRDQVDEYYLTVAEVAELLRLNQQTVRNWIDQGSLPALRVGRRVRIKRSDLDRLLSEGYRAGSQGVAADSGPSAEDFWGGEPVGFADLADGLREEGSALADDDSALGNEGTGLLHEGATARHEGATARHEGATARHEGATARHAGAGARDGADASAPQDLSP